MKEMWELEEEAYMDYLEYMDEEAGFDDYCLIEDGPYYA